MRILICVATIVFSAAASSFAGHTTAADSVHDKGIERQLALIAPHAVPPFQEATRALASGDAVEAARLYDQVLAEAPSFSPAMRRLGEALVAAGQRERGLGLLTRAVAQERSPENLYTLASALAYPAGGKQPSTTDRERALALAKEAVAQPGQREDSDYAALVAATAASMQRWTDFRAAVTTLRAGYPDDVRTHYCSAILAAVDEDWIAAEREIHMAERLGLPHEAVAAFLDSGVGMWARVWRSVHVALYALTAWAVGLLLLFYAGRWLSGATLESIDAADPNLGPSARELRLRRVYRALIRAAAVYYYVSLPFALLLVILSTAAVFYGFMLINWLPIKIALMLAIGALITVYKMVQSLFVKIESTDPGRNLNVAEASGLWALTRAVADQVGTRTIDEIRVTPGTEFAVYERGTRQDRRQDRARRTLILGTGVINGFRQGAFGAVLAHEYGHFAHRDTAGGDVALRVRQDIIKFAFGMAQHGQAVPWNLAFQFLRVYDFLFRRISHGATRLQEVMADRVAAQNYGRASFEEGLRHVIRAAIEFDAAVSGEIQSAIDAGRPVQNIYALESPRTDDVDRMVEEAIARVTTEDDTHPGPQDRFRMVNRIAWTGPAAEPGLVWDLFTDREALTQEMTAAVESQLSSVRTEVPEE
jgi:tetratricopeptide (TPR) repeat protein